MGLEIGIGWLTFFMFGTLIFLLLLGLPLAFVTGGLGVVFLFLFGDAQMLNILPSRIFPFMTDYQLSAIPLFIFMASVLAAAGLIEELFDVVYQILGGLKGGLATATIIASTILAAMVGVIGAAEVTMGIIALPAMLKRKYNPELACGSILAGGTLGILIPPSILAIIFAVVAQQSVGELFIGAFFPGFLLSGMYILYVTTRSYMKEGYGPALPKEERISVIEKFKLLKGIIAPILLVMPGFGGHFYRCGHSGGGRRYRHLWCPGGGRPVAQAVLDQYRHGRHDHPQGVHHGAVDHVRRQHLRRLLHRQRRSAVCHRIPAGHRPGALRHFNDHDGPVDPARHVPGLGGHSAAGGSDFRPDYALPALGWGIWFSGSASRGGVPVVRGGLHGQHADVLFKPAFRIRSFLSEKRGAAGNHHGNHIPGCGALSVFAGRRAGPGCYLPRNYSMAAED